MRALIAALAVVTIGAAARPAPTAADYAADARDLRQLIADHYAYPDHLPNGTVPQSAALEAERDAVHDRDTLLHYAEDMIATLADHHAITGASFGDDWALVPSFADLWVEDGRITAVRDRSPAARAGIMAGDKLAAVGGVALPVAAAAFWSRLGLPVTPERRDHAERVLAAGRRNAARVLSVTRDGRSRDVTLPSLYAEHRSAGVLTVTANTIRLNDSLGEHATIAAFDAAMAALPSRAAVTVDLTDTASGGNTSVARAMMGWFVRRAMPYQVHNLPSEERETGVPRQWLEEVLPRPGRYHPGPVTVLVGRWTGSMGEGLAIGFAAIGARVCGGPMAGLKGAVYDLTLERSGLVVKVPAERLYTVDGQPRERWTPGCRAA
ncbi:S41 family peptidase [Sphingomonas sp.]|uniref:S41 family peptidase n=1 Tax=Sphingomonas sp. TaxID=28214 RepID=UPI003CC6A689